jgi:hypothetical protein
MKLKTVFSRLSQNHAESSYYRICRYLDKSPLGEVKIHKNLHHIISVLAVKPS